MLIPLLVVLLLAVSLVLILVVLIQRPQGGGLSGAFGAGGSGGAGQTAFGTKTGDMLTLFTIGCFVAFLGLGIGLNYALRPPEASAAQTAAGAGAAPADGATAEDLLIEGDDAATATDEAGQAGEAAPIELPDTPPAEGETTPPPAETTPQTETVPPTETTPPPASGSGTGGEDPPL
ncbi:MAG: preprotein translocase subunit SecG [Planctomycetota bacterium]